MGVFYKISDLMARQRKRFHDTMGTAEDKWKALIEISLKDMRQLTSGTISEKQLALLGHPYAREAVTKARPMGRMRGARRVGQDAVERMLGRTTVPKLPVNAQSNRLTRSFRVFFYPAVGGDISGAVGPDSSAGKSANAILRDGTFKSGRNRGGVIARGFWQEVERRFNARKKAFIQELRRVNGAP